MKKALSWIAVVLIIVIVVAVVLVVFARDTFEFGTLFQSGADNKEEQTEPEDTTEESEEETSKDPYDGWGSPIYQ